MAEPVPIALVRYADKPVEGIVSYLERLLAEAKSGELRAISVACIYASDGKPDGASNAGIVLGSFTSYRMAYALRTLSLKFDDEVRASTGLS